MARPTGAKGKITGDVRDALLRSFHRGGGDRWLSRLMMNDARTYCSLLSRCIPNEILATVSHIDLGAAMLEAQSRLTVEKRTEQKQMIDITPDLVEIATVDDLSG